MTEGDGAAVYIDIVFSKIDAQISYNLTDMYGSILVTGAMGYGLNVLFLAIEKRLVHWSGH